jgi:hypothetical protein
MDDQTQQPTQQPLDSDEINEEVNGEANTLLTIQSAIKTRITQIERIKNDLKPHKEMIDSFLGGDETYVKLAELAKESSKKKTAYKNQLLQDPSAAQISTQIDSLKEQLKDLQEGLSYYLREYQRLTGANEIEGSDGELRQIVYNAKLVRKTALNKE